MELGENFDNVQVMKGYKESVNEHHKQAVKGLFDNAAASALKALVSDESESNVEANIGK